MTRRLKFAQLHRAGRLIQHIRGFAGKTSSYCPLPSQITRPEQCLMLSKSFVLHHHGSRTLAHNQIVNRLKSRQGCA